MVRNSPQISVVIITRNRPEKLLQCLKSLAQNTIKNVEVIIVDQSDKENTKLPLSRVLHKIKIQYLHSKERGKTRGLNTAIPLCSAPIIAFTDDDCIVTKKWLENILNSFDRHREISAVFGSTYPNDPENHKSFFCPSTFSPNTPEHKMKHLQKWESVGVGNNMAYRKKVFTELGLFKEWLGPGSIGSNGEDAEMALRALGAGKTLLYNPQVRVVHDRWLTLRELNTQDLSYICGETACYTYLALNRVPGAKELFLADFKVAFTDDAKKIMSYALRFKSYFFSLVFWWILKMTARLRGLIVASLVFLLGENVFL